MIQELWKNGPFKDLTDDLKNARRDQLVFLEVWDNLEEKKAIISEEIRSQTSKGIKVLTYQEFQVENANFLKLSRDDFYNCRSWCANQVYGVVPNKPIIGITGTNGKTTTAHFIHQMAKAIGKNCLSIGTLGLIYNERVVQNKFTTPPYIELRKLLSLYGQDVDLIVMEISSHAIHQARIYGIPFECGAWTSFSQDHLDYHASIKEYFLVKEKFARDVIDAGKKFFVHDDSLEIKNESNLSFHYVRNLQSYPPQPFLKFAFNKRNFDLAKCCVEEVLGESIAEGTMIPSPPGRCEILEEKGKTVIIDYAHTPDALEKTILNIKESFPGKFLFCVFGCGGDRDRTKRPLMGKIVAKNCDRSVVTSDNPRFEKPHKIIEDIVKGMKGAKFEEIENRKTAIDYAFSETPESGILLIAGKGHEDYQEIEGERHPFSDKEIVKNL